MQAGNPAPLLDKSIRGNFNRLGIMLVLDRVFRKHRLE